MFLSLSGPHPDPHSFPTRRSSDLFRVSLEVDDLHAVAQGVGNGIEHVGGGDEQHPAEIEGDVQVVVAEGGILLRVEHLEQDRKSTRLNSSHPSSSYAVFCLKKKTR